MRESVPSVPARATPPKGPQPRTSRWEKLLEVGVGLVLRERLRLRAGADLSSVQF